MRLILSLFFCLLVFSQDALACKKARDRINKFFESRTNAFNQAKRDAKIPKNAEATVKRVPLDLNGEPVLDANKQIVMTREYHFKNTDGKNVIIQEHTFGHEGSIKEAGGMAHFNVRPADDARTGRFPGTAAHYNIGAE